jgi:hypothetical protein
MNMYTNMYMYLSMYILHTTIYCYGHQQMY